MTMIVRTWLVVAILLATESFAAPTLQVRGKAEIELNPISRSYDAVTIRGKLRDRYEGNGIPWSAIRVRLGLQERRTQTDGSGKFEVSFSVSDGVYPLEVSFSGTSHFSSAQVLVPSVDVSKESLHLRVVANPVVDHGVDVNFVVRAEIDDPETPVGDNKRKPVEATLPVTAFLADARGDANIRQVGQELEISLGKMTLTIPPDVMGEPGPKVLSVKFDGNAAFNSARAETKFVARAQTATTLVIKSGLELAYEETLTAAGTVKFSANDEPVTEGAVVLIAGRKRIGQGVTNGDGKYEIEVPGSEFRPGEYTLQTVFEPSGRARSQSRSSPVTVTVLAAKPVSARTSLYVFLGVVIVVILLLIFGRKRQDVKPSETEDRLTRERAATRGLVPKKSRLTSTLRRANVRAISGRVLSIPHGDPIEGAVIRVGDGVEVHSEQNGRFTSPSLSAGRYNVEVWVEDCLPETFELTLPHKGEFTDCEIHVMPIREGIFRAYQDLVFPILPADKQDIWTPRQILDHMSKAQSSEALTALTRFVEDTYFGSQPLSMNDMTEARSLAIAAESHLGAAGDSGPGQHTDL